MAIRSRLFVIPIKRPFLVKNVFFMSSACEPSTSTSTLSSSSSSSSSEDSSRSVRVWAWWDFKSCNIPSGFDAAKVCPAIMEAVRANGIKGPLNITAFGDVQQLSKTQQEALAYTGVRFTHVTNDARNSADILVDLMYWVSQNPPPAHVFLISGDREFAGVLHRLRMSNYNILLATPEKMAPGVLCSAATIAWQWNSLLKGENLTVKHFNYPPDGPCGSWYGSYKVAHLEKPVAEPPPLANVEVYEPASVPKSVVKQVRRILSLHPKGIGIADLCAELAKCDVRLNKNWFGHKKFSRFVELRPGGDGSLCVHLVSSKLPEAAKLSGVKNEKKGCAMTPKVNGEDNSKVRDEDETSSIASVLERSLDDDLKSFQSGLSQGKPVEKYVDGELSSPVTVQSDVCQPLNELQKSSVTCDKVVDVANAQQLEIQLPSKDGKDSETEIDLLKITSQQSPDNDVVRSEDASHKSREKHTTSENHSAENDHTRVENNVIINYESGNFEAKNKSENPSRMEIDEVFCSPSSSPDVCSPVVERPGGGNVETNSRRPTFFSWIRSWWPFGKSNAKHDNSTAHHNEVVNHAEDSKLSELCQTVSQFEEPRLSDLDQNASHVEDPKLSELDQNVSHSGKSELFSSASFWNEMESFIFAPKGSLLFSQSRSREDVVRKLRNGGPLVLRSLPEKDIFQLVGLMIAEKNWLEERPSQTFPFKVIKPVQKDSLMDQSPAANALRSLFVSRTSQSNLQKSIEHNVEIHNQSGSRTQVSAPATETNYTERSRNDILEDCQKLASDILREYPEGYNIGGFRRQFLNRYGYHLDIQKLGYQKLAALLQIMPGVKLESTFIFPSVPDICDSNLETSILKTQVTTDSHAASKSDSELSEPAPKNDNMETLWEELGPVSVNKSHNSGLESKSSQKAIELDTSISEHPDYEPVISDDDSSASEADSDSSCLIQTQKQRKPKCNEQDSSFWQAMDLWHSCKEGENSVKKSDNVDSLGASLADILDSSTESTRDTFSKTPSSNYTEISSKKSDSDNVERLDVSLSDFFNPSTESTRGTISRIPSSSYREKQRSHKNYSFVADPVLPNKDELVDGLKKSDGLKMQN